MYFYVYDSFLQDKKYAKILAEIEAKLIDLSIQGRTTKLNILNDMRELIGDAVRRGAETVVVLGDDKTVSKALQGVADLNVTVGFIPVGSGPHALARYIGIPEGIAACEVVSRRIKERIDIARVNGNYFAFYLKSLSPHIKIVSPDRKYSITPIATNAEVYICNFKPAELDLEYQHTQFFKPQDGKLELVVNTVPESSFFNKFFKTTATSGEYTILSFEKIRLEQERPEYDVRLVLDGDKIIKPPVEITVVPQKVEVIVGTERLF